MTSLGPSPYVRLFLLSFLTLFLELTLIRWVPGVVRLVAYYANLLLISSFLGLGIGALLSRRTRPLLPYFGAALLANVALVLLIANVALPGSTVEFRFFSRLPGVLNWVALVLIFFMNAAVFVPLGHAIGTLFEDLATLRAYSWDLLGSLAGTIAFGLFAFYSFSPLAGVAGVSLLCCLLLLGRTRAVAANAVLLGATVLVLFATTDRDAIWSPYYHIGVEEVTSSADEPPPRDVLRTMQDPPIYGVRVNQDFYQFHATFDPRRYTPGGGREQFARRYGTFHAIPFRMHPDPKSVLVIGAGGGPDAEAALLAGAEHVDAVDIDPVLLDISDRYNPSGVYDDPRVEVHLDDARAFIRRTDRTYDMVVFAYLDSQALSSARASIRLDSYVYTVESMREALGLLNEGGALTVSFATKSPWLSEKLTSMLADAAGRPPAVYYDGTLLTLAVATHDEPLPARIGDHERIEPAIGELARATDDWPYLYLGYRTIPADYLVVIVTLLTLSIVALLALTPRSAERGGAGYWDFLFLGAGFLLLQTKSVIDCALYFGSTWFVTTTVIAGVLLMVFLANLVAMRLKAFHPAFYLPLIASLVLLYVMPRAAILELPFAGRMLWTLLIVPLPIFFAGLVFSTRFRAVRSPAAAFGANLIGAMAGGFLEYLGMITGSRALLLIVIAAYLASLIAARAADRLGEAPTSTRPAPEPVPA